MELRSQTHRRVAEQDRSIPTEAFIAIALGVRAAGGFDVGSGWISSCIACGCPPAEQELNGFRTRGTGVCRAASCPKSAAVSAPQPGLSRTSGAWRASSPPQVFPLHRDDTAGLGRGSDRPPPRRLTAARILVGALFVFAILATIGRTRSPSCPAIDCEQPHDKALVLLSSPWAHDQTRCAGAWNRCCLKDVELDIVCGQTTVAAVDLPPGVRRCSFRKTSGRVEDAMPGRGRARRHSVLLRRRCAAHRSAVRQARCRRLRCVARTWDSATAGSRSAVRCRHRPAGSTRT